jgi:shikimate kinase
LSARTVRRVVVAVCVCGIAGMIVSSIADNTGAAMTFGLVVAAAVACLMVATAVSAPSRIPETDASEADAARVEEIVGRLVEQGADEETVRDLVRHAIRLGRGS